MRFVVGYVPNHRGTEAVKLGATLAGSRDAVLEIVVVLPPANPTFHMYSPDRSYQEELERQAGEWLDDAMKYVPDGLTATTTIVRSESITEGLIEAASDPARGAEAGLIVIGASKRGLVGRFTTGSVAASLLHSSPVPVALAPAGYEPHPSITRITCAVGTRQGADAVVDVAVAAAAARRVPLRLMSLVALGHGGSDEERQAWIQTADKHEAELMARAQASLPADCPVTGVVGTGKSLEECVQSLDFTASEMVLVGSSRLGSPKRLFIGASANKILRALPVPMVVVPRDYELPAEAWGGIREI